MTLFNRNNNQQEVPEIQIQGDEATIPQPEETAGNDVIPTDRRVRIPPKSWGQN
jgi:hypothetical protein